MNREDRAQENPAPVVPPALQPILELGGNAALLANQDIMDDEDDGSEPQQQTLVQREEDEEILIALPADEMQEDAHVAGGLNVHADVDVQRARSIQLRKRITNVIIGAVGIVIASAGGASMFGDTHWANFIFLAVGGVVASTAFLKLFEPILL